MSDNAASIQAATSASPDRSHIWKLPLAFLLGIVTGVAASNQPDLQRREDTPEGARSATEATSRRTMEKSLSTAQEELKRAQSETTRAREENSSLRASADAAEVKVATLEAELAAEKKARSSPPTASAGAGETSPPATEDTEATLAKLDEQFKKVAKLGLMGVGGEKFRSLAEAVKALGPVGITMLAERLTKGENTATRFLAAALFEHLADPAAAPSLVEALQNDSDSLVRRMASHALAVGQMETGYDALERAMIADQDWGVRVNSAYGLAKNGRSQGLTTLVNAYESPDTPNEYRISILGGISDVAAPSTAPLFRKILAEKDDMTYLYLAINALEKMKDRDSLDALANLIAQGKEDSVKEAAKKAYNTIVGQEIYK